MADRDYYEILEIPRSASPDQIKTAYRRLAKRYHPDRNRNDKSAEGRFKELHQAYEVLNDPAKRRAYDQYGHAGVHGMGGGGPGGGHGAGWRPTGAGGWQTGPGGQRVYTYGGPGFGGYGGTGGAGAQEVPIEDIEDLFSIFGGGPSAGPGSAGGNAGAGSSAFEGFFNKMGGGRGRGRGGGRGRASRQESAVEQGAELEHEARLGFLQAIHGAQLELRITRGDREETVTVKIPPGVRDGQRIRVRGKGHPGIGGGQAGDLYIKVRIEPHPYWRRVDDDIYLELPLNLTEAALGTKVDIPTLEGRTVLTVPPGTPCGAKLRLKNQGVRPPGNGKGEGDKPRGHQYMVVKIVPPKTLTPEQTRLLEEFRQCGENNPRADVGW